MSKKKGSSSKASRVFEGETFCVSGKFTVSQGELVSAVEGAGGAIAATPNRSCTFVVSDSIGSAKTTKAVKDGIDVVTEAWVSDSIAAGKKLTNAKYFLSGGGGGGNKSGGAAAKKAKAAKADEDEEEDDEPKKQKKATAKASSKKKPAAAAAAAAAATKPKGAGKRKAAAVAEEEEEEAEEAEEEAKVKAPPKKAAKTAQGKKAAGAASSKKAAAKKGKKAQAAAEEEEDEDEDEEMDDGGKDSVPASASVSPSAAASASSSAAPSAAAAAATAASSLPSPGAAASKKPDRDVPGRDSYSIVDDYAVLLNQTNITGGRNNNKFYVLQLLKSAGGSHAVWTRWGRVGESGESKLIPCGDLKAAVKAFESKFRDKTKNSWADRANFKKHNDKYELVEVEEGGEGEGDSPLGRLSKAQIEKGQAVLASLRADLEAGKKSSVGDLSAAYYTLIPTVVGRQAAPALSTLDAVTEKEELLKFMLRMGFEVEEADTGLSPIDGILELPLPKSLSEAALGVTSSHDIKSADERGKQLSKKQAGRPLKQMDPHLYAAIMLYTSNAIYAQLNAALREEKRAKVRAYFRYLRLFLEAMGTLPGQAITLWRGISVDVGPQYKVGETITWWGVSSCTSDLNVANGFMRSCGGSTTLLTIRCKSACDISDITYFSHEKEALLAPGTMVKVLSNKKNGNVTEITVEEVGQAFARG